MSLTAFYRRRIFRILPAYYTFLATVMLLSAFRGGGGAGWTKIWPATIFVTDYVDVPLVVGHTWSLAVEEQFYLLWPAMFLVGLRRSFVVCIAILFLAPLFRVLADNGLWPTKSSLRVRMCCGRSRGRVPTGTHSRPFMGQL